MKIEIWLKKVKLENIRNVSEIFSSLYQNPTAGRFFKLKKKYFRVRVRNVEAIFLSHKQGF